MKEFDTIIEMCLLEVHEKGEVAIKTICNCVIPSHVMIIEYKKLSPIEELPDHDKKELKKYVIETLKGKTKEELVNCAKIVYTIGTLI